MLFSWTVTHRKPFSHALSVCQWLPELMVSASALPPAGPPCRRELSVRAVQARRQHQRVSVTGSELSAAVTPSSLAIGPPAAQRRLSGAPTQTVSVQATAMLVDCAQSPGTSMRTTTVSGSREASASDEHGACCSTDVAPPRHGACDLWPVSASVAAWLDGALEPHVAGQSSASWSVVDVSRTVATSTAGPTRSELAGSLPEAGLALGHNPAATPVSSRSSPEHDFDAPAQAGSLHAAAAPAVRLDLAGASPGGADTLHDHDAPRTTPVANGRPDELRPGPWQVSGNTLPADAARADVVDSADVRSGADAAPGVARAAADVTEAAMPPASQPLRERSAQTAVQIAPHVTVELRTVAERHPEAAAARSAEPPVLAVASWEVSLPAPDAETTAAAPQDGRQPVQARNAEAATSHAAALPPPVPVCNKAPSIASTASRRGSLRALKLRLASRGASDTPRPQSAPTGGREPTLVQPRWSIARPASPSRDHKQACAVNRH